MAPCAVDGEVHDGNECKCGDSPSCEGAVTGAFCDATNSVCKCAQDVDACPDGQVCESDACGMYIFGKQQQSLLNALYIEEFQVIVTNKHFISFNFSCSIMCCRRGSTRWD